MKCWFVLIALFASCRATQLLQRTECHVVAKIGGVVYYCFGRRVEGQRIIQILAADVYINGKKLSCETLKFSSLKEGDGIWVLFGPIASLSEWRRLESPSAENKGNQVQLKYASLEREPFQHTINGLNLHGFYKYIETEEFKTWIAVKNPNGTFTFVNNILVSSSKKGVQYGILRIPSKEGENLNLFTKTDPSTWSVFLHGSETTVPYPTTWEFDQMKHKVMRVNIKKIPNKDESYDDFEISVRPSEVDVTFYADVEVHKLSGLHRGEVMKNSEIKMSGKILESLNTIYVFEKPSIKVDGNYYGFDHWKRMFEYKKNITKGEARFVSTTSHPEPKWSLEYKDMSRITDFAKRKGLEITYVHTNTTVDLPQQNVW